MVCITVLEDACKPVELPGSIVGPRAVHSAAARSQGACTREGASCNERHHILHIIHIFTLVPEVMVRGLLCAGLQSAHVFDRLGMHFETLASPNCRLTLHVVATLRGCRVTWSWLQLLRLAGARPPAAGQAGLTIACPKVCAWFKPAMRRA